METKLLEVRDHATLIPVLAIKLSKTDGRLAQRAGYGETPCILLGKLDGGRFRYDPYEWGRTNRTYTAAHMYIAEHFDDLTDGEVIDVRYYLGEAHAPCESECGGASVGRGQLQR